MIHANKSQGQSTHDQAVQNANPKGAGAGAVMSPPTFQLSSSSAKASDPSSKAGEKKVKPFTVSGTGEHKVFTPLKPNGKTLYFFYGYTGSKEDQKMRDDETANVADDVLNAAASGFKVVYDTAGTKAEFLSALYDPTCAGIYWSGHGGGGGFQTSDGGWVDPSDINPKSVSPKLVYLILAACQSGTKAKEWKAAVGSSVQFQGWVKNTNTSETNDFTSTASIGDSWVSHNGTMPGMELAGHINSAASAK
jgi:hypothetical protein